MMRPRYQKPDNGSFLKTIRIAWQFLFIIPIGRQEQVSENDLAKSVVAYPGVSLLEGIIFALLGFLFLRSFSSEMTAALLVTGRILINGGFHLDGLADTFDGFAKPGGAEEKLAIMKTGSVGPAGVTAIVLSIVVKLLLMKDLIDASQPLFFASILVLPVVSKWAMVMAMFHGRPARPEGLGRIFIGAVPNHRFLAITGQTLVFLVLTIFLAGRGDFILIPVLLAGLVVILYGACLFLIRTCGKNFGGLTGDTLGATAELAEIIMLFWVMLCSRISIL